MKVHVLFDDKGHVGAMSHSKHRKDASGVEGGFLPGPGQYTAILEIPKELEHLKPRELHEAVCVEHKDGTPRLVAKRKPQADPVAEERADG
jgi:hypothetical protein